MKDENVFEILICAVFAYFFLWPTAPVDVTPGAQATVCSSMGR